MIDSNEDTNIGTQKDSQPLYVKGLYTVSEDGHFVSEDGYIVPKNFTEFYSRYPDQVRKFIRSRKWFRLNYGDRMDECEQMLLMHLMTLPLKSVYRERGMHDRIETFDPESSYGASEGRFLYYIHRTLQNGFVDIVRTAAKDPVDNGYSLDTNLDSSLPNSREMSLVCSSVIDDSLLASKQEMNEAADRVDTQIFQRFVRLHNPELIPVLLFLIENPSAIDCRNYMNLSKQLFYRARRRLAYLHECWVKGSRQVKRQRRVYPCRAKKAVSSTPNEVLEVESAYPQVEACV